MSVRVLAMATLVFAPAYVESGGVACPFAIATCQAGLAAGLLGCVGPHAPICVGFCYAGYATCMAAANSAAVAATCFDGANLVMTKNGTAKVSEVKPGDLIATTNPSGELTYTRVAQNSLLKSTGTQFAFKQVQLANGKSFNVTNEHFVVVEALSGELQIKRAEQVHVGDVMISQPSERAQVVDVGTFTMYEKWTLGTASGTALVNGVMMTAICDTVDDLPVNFEEAMQMWRETHEHVSNMDVLGQISA